MTKKTEGKRPARAKSTVELNDLKNWLATQNIGLTREAVHVNGHQHPSAIVSVDLGQMLKQARLTQDQSYELAQRLRRVAKEVLGKDVNIRVGVDNSHGIHWASVA
jgi:hypothetical protein